MSNFLNKIPVSPITSFGNPSVPIGSTIGTNFSILQTGGFMEVYTLSGLTYTIPPVTTGIIEFSGNSIPIQFTKGSGSVFSPDVLTLNSDNISSGRRKLGMLTYVYETNKIYQFKIDNYSTLWNNATGATGPGGPTVVISDFGTTVKNNSAAGIAFINAWTSSTISGIGGYDDTNASWRVLSTGGNSGGGTSITGGTFNNNTDTLTLNNSTGGTITITGFTDYYTTGFTFNPSTYGLTIQRNDGLPNLSVDLSILASDVTITGGTYNSSTGTATFTNNTGGTFNVTGFLTGFTDIYVTGGTFNSNNRTLTLTRTDNVNVTVTGFTDVFVTGTTKSGSVATFRNNTGGTFTLTGLTDTFVTGATKSGSVATFTNNTGGTFTLTGLTDVFVTGGTHSLTGGTTTFRNNTGGTFNVSGYFTPSNDIYVIGGTVDHGPSDSDDNSLILNRSDSSNVTISNLVNISPATKSEIDSLISNKWIIRGKTYKISGCDFRLYDNGTDREDAPVYTSIYLMGLENNKLSETGIGVFYTPKYSEFPIFVDGNLYGLGDRVIWGGYVWECIGGTQVSIDIFTLDPNGFEIIYPFEGSNSYRAGLYNIQYDDIIYDYTNDKIIYRNEQNSNIVSTTYENIDYWENEMSLYNPIKAFQWGNLFSDNRGIGNQTIVNSYNENINYTGEYQINLNFKNNSYQKNIISDVGEGNYQDGIILENYSYIDTISLRRSSSYQSNIKLSNNSYISNIILDRLAYQNKIILDNNSYINNIDMSSAQDAYQSRIFLSNDSYISNGSLSTFSYQTNFVFNNGSYMDTFDLAGDCSQQNFNFTNLSYQNNFTVAGVQEFIYMDNGSQSNGFSESQSNITVKGYNIDWSSYPSISPQTDLYFIHNLVIDETAPVYIGKINNRLVEVTKPIDIFVTGGTYSSGSGIITFTNNSGGTFTVSGITSGGGGTFTGGTVTGPTIFTNGLTANTISATTYQNLPIDIRVTGGTYTNGTATFRNNTGGTFNVTGLTTPFTGGTVTGATNFTGGLIATTISATTYQNLPIDIRVTGGTYTSGNVIFTNNTGGTFTVTGFAVGGGGGQLFYLNLSESEGSNRLLSTTASNSSQQTSGVTISSGVTGTIASFQSPQLNTILLPGGVWSFHLHSYKEDINSSFDIFVEVYKRTSGGTQTLLFQTEPTTVLTNSPLPSMQITESYFSGTSLVVSDSIVTIVRATNTGNQTKTITFVTEGTTYYSYVVSSLPTQQGLTCETLSGCSIIQTIQTNVSNKLDKSGGTITGNLVINLGLTANTISATTYQNLPTDIRVTGGTYSNGTATFTNNTGGTFNVTGLYTGGTDVFVTGATKSGDVATFTNNTGGTFTLTGLTDTFVTGGTYDTGTSSITFTNNSGGTFTVSGITSGGGGGTFSGGTVNGATTFTNGLTANTISATTITSPSISPYGLIVATSLGYQNIF
jgi:hypothetical protein